LSTNFDLAKVKIDVTVTAAAPVRRLDMHKDQLFLFPLVCAADSLIDRY
jgi:hypothetical protein